MGSFLSGVIASDERVRIPVHVRGMGRAFECMLELWDEQSSSGRSYTRCRITDDPPDLPNGRYYLELGKFVVQTGKYCGEWELVFLSLDVQGKGAA